LVLDDPWALEHGLLTLRRIRREHDDPTRLHHCPGGVGGLLDDQVQVAVALLEAYEATAEAEWLAWAGALLDRVWEEYLDPEAGGLFDTSRRAGEGLLPTRIKPVQDAPTPSPNGVAALGAARLAELTGEPRWAARRDALLRAFAGSAVQLGIHGATYLLALDWAVHPVTHLVIFDGEATDDATLAQRLERLAHRTFVPRRLVQRVGRRATPHPVLPGPLAAALAPDSPTQAVACRGVSCQAPARSLDEWRQTLQRLSVPGP
jgi:uncharacterized protein YyaL (SSP411 family)